MGTKRALATTVAKEVAASRVGPFLDLFAGMCSVGSVVGTSRAVWNNDLQRFASTVANAFFCATEAPPVALDIFPSLRADFMKNITALKEIEIEDFQAESAALQSCSVCDLLEFNAKMAKRATSAEINEQRASRRSRFSFPFALFTWNFAGSYLGLSQCMEVDSVRYALDNQAKVGTLTTAAHEWLCLALARAVSRCSTSTGHFAQPLTPKSSNIDRYIRQRRRSVWSEWFDTIDTLQPLGNSRWRATNKAMCSEAVHLVQKWTGPTPGVVYADPPYTNDQYSRYYHLYETLLLYDYPVAQGIGRYREDRKISSFSMKAGVTNAFEEMISGVASMRSDLVVSYPVNGLLANSRERIPDMLRRHFKSVYEPIELSHSHSTMGGSKGPAASVVTEVIYRAAT
jgi:adenine-specific DNA-methyltransferase